MYNKIFTKILDSSIWLESDTTRIVWLTLLAAMDQDGFAQFASVANLAHRARVTEESARAAVKVLEAPDKNSSDPSHRGRRLERVPGGWMVLNAEKYRDLITSVVAREKTRERVRKFRENRRKEGVSVTHCNGALRKANGAVTPSETETEALAEAHTQTEEIKNIEPVSVALAGLPPIEAVTPDELMEAWNAGTTTPIPKCLKLSDARKVKAGCRLKDATLDEWRAVIAKINASAFCRGESDRGTWTANFDWLLKPDTRIRVLEGQYDNKATAAPRGPETAARYTARAVDDLKALLDAKEQEDGHQGTGRAYRLLAPSGRGDAG